MVVLRSSSQAAPAASTVRALGDLSLQWYEGWCDDLERALMVLPPMATCSSDLFRELATCETAVPRKLALVRAGAEPVALVALRKRGKRWDPLCQGVCLGSYFPVRDGYFVPTLKKTNLPIALDYWEGALPEENLYRPISYAAFAANCASGAIEEFWRERGTWRAIRKTRNRTQSFDFLIDEPGAAEWIVRRWSEKWDERGSSDTVTRDAVLVAVRHWRRTGELKTFRLIDGQRPVAGLVALAQSDTLLLHTIYRDPAYHRYSIGTRILDAAIMWARDNGFARVDFGGGADYKSQLAPEDRKIWAFEVLPRRYQASDFVTRAGRGLLRRARQRGVLLGKALSWPDTRQAANG